MYIFRRTSIYMRVVVLGIFTSGVACHQRIPADLLTPRTPMQPVAVATHEAKNYDPALLNIHQASFTKRILGQGSDQIEVAVIRIAGDENTDYYTYQACPLSGKIPCFKGEISGDQDLLCISSPGEFRVSLQACLEAEHSSDHDHPCAPSWTLPTTLTISTFAHQDNGALFAKLCLTQQQLADQAHTLVTQLASTLATTNEESARVTALQNVVTVGPHRFAHDVINNGVELLHSLPAPSAQMSDDRLDISPDHYPAIDISKAVAAFNQQAPWAAKFGVENDIFPRIEALISSWAITQEYNLHAQYENSIRSFDIRLADIPIAATTQLIRPGLRTGFAHGLVTFGDTTDYNLIGYLARSFKAILKHHPRDFLIAHLIAESTDKETYPVSSAALLDFFAEVEGYLPILPAEQDKLTAAASLESYVLSTPLNRLYDRNQRLFLVVEAPLFEQLQREAADSPYLQRILLLPRFENKRSITSGAETPELIENSPQVGLNNFIATKGVSDRLNYITYGVSSNESIIHAQANAKFTEQTITRLTAAHHLKFGLKTWDEELQLSRRAVKWLEDKLPLPNYLLAFDFIEEVIPAFSPSLRAAIASDPHKNLHQQLILGSHDSLTYLLKGYGEQTMSERVSPTMAAIGGAGVLISLGLLYGSYKAFLAYQKSRPEKGLVAQNIHLPPSSNKAALVGSIVAGTLGAAGLVMGASLLSSFVLVPAFQGKQSTSTSSLGLSDLASPTLYSSLSEQLRKLKTLLDLQKILLQRLENISKN